MLLAVTTALALVYWYERARHATAVDPAGVVTVGALSIFFVGASLLSPQYLAWGLPFAAIAAHERRWRVTGGYFAAVLLDVVYVVTTDLTRPDGVAAHVQVLVRNGVLLALVVVCFRELYCVSRARRTSASRSTYALPLTSTVTEWSVPVKGFGAA